MTNTTNIFRIFSDIHGYFRFLPKETNMTSLINIFRKFTDIQGYYRFLLTTTFAVILVIGNFRASAQTTPVKVVKNANYFSHKRSHSNRTKHKCKRRYKGSYRGKDCLSPS